MLRIPDIEPVSDSQGLRLLCAARNGSSREVAALIESGVDVDAPDSNGVTPLIFAAMAGHLEVVEVLLGAGADPGREDALGYTAYKAAMLYGDFRGATQPPHDAIMARLGPSTAQLPAGLSSDGLFSRGEVGGAAQRRSSPIR